MPPAGGCQSTWTTGTPYGANGSVRSYPYVTNPGYITPVSTLVKWFPDKRGRVTGLAVFGFGLSAAIFGPLAIAAAEDLEGEAGAYGLPGE